MVEAPKGDVRSQTPGESSGREVLVSPTASSRNRRDSAEFRHAIGELDSDAYERTLPREYRLPPRD